MIFRAESSFVQRHGSACTFHRLVLTFIGIICVAAPAVLSAQPCPPMWEADRLLADTPNSTFSSWLVGLGNTAHVLVLEHDPYLLSYRNSTDQGVTWGNRRILVDDSLHTQVSRRQLAVNGPNVHVVWENDNYSGVETSLKIRRSTDGGSTWLGTQIIVNVPSDRLFIFPQVATLDSTVLVEAIGDPVGAGGWERWLARSEDAGATWGPIRQITPSVPSRGGIGDLYTSGGTVFLVFPMETASGSEISCIRSTDKGITWTPDNILSTIDNYDAWIPQMAADLEGNVYVGWLDRKYGSIDGFAGTLLIRRSTDLGQTWLPERRISSLASVDFFSLVARGNKVVAMWQDGRSGVQQPRVYSSGSSDDGETWCNESFVGLPNLVSQLPCLAASDNFVHASRAINFNGQGYKIYYTRAELVTGVAPVDNQIPTRSRLLAPYPNPFNDEVTISFEVATEGDVSVTVFDMLGKRISTVADGAYEPGRHKVRWSGTGLASGVYRVVLSTHAGKEGKPIVLLK